MRRQSVIAIFVTEISVIDPISNLPVEIEIWKDPISGGLFGIDTSFLDQVSEGIVSPFAVDEDIVLLLELPEIKE